MRSQRIRTFLADDGASVPAGHNQPVATFAVAQHSEVGVRNVEFVAVDLDSGSIPTSQQCGQPKTCFELGLALG